MERGGDNTLGIEVAIDVSVLEFSSSSDDDDDDVIERLWQGQLVYALTR